MTHTSPQIISLRRQLAALDERERYTRLASPERFACWEERLKLDKELKAALAACAEGGG
jgi:hypothetical protein